MDVFRLIGGSESESEDGDDGVCGEEEDEKIGIEYSDVAFDEKEVEDEEDEEEEEEEAFEQRQHQNPDDLNWKMTIPVSKKEIDGTDILALSLFVEEPRGIVPTKKKKELSKKSDDILFAFSLDNILSKSECERLVSLAERVSKTKTYELEFTFWNRECKTEEDIRIARAYRNVDTMEFRHEAFAKLLWERIRPYLDSYEMIDLRKHNNTDPRWQVDLEGVWDAYGTNPNILLGRYASGGHFAPHTDGYDIINFNDRSMMSIVLYLNDCPHGGGDTRFYSDKLRSNLKRDKHGRWTGTTSGLEIATVRPDFGRASIFFHNHMHEGVPPNPGSFKYFIRSDIMYRRRKPICTKPNDIKAFELYRKANECDIPEKSRELFRECFRLSPELADVYGM